MSKLQSPFGVLLWLLAKDIPAIDIQGLANDVFGLGRREKYCRRRNFERATHASVRHGKSHLAFLLSQRKAKLAGVEGVDTIPHFGINNARCDSVHPDAVFDQGQRCRLRQADHCGLSCSVDGRSSFAAPARLRRHIDDATAAAISHHQPGDGLEDEKDALHVDLEQAFETLRRDVEERSHVEDRRVVDEDVDPAGAFGRFVNGALDRADRTSIQPHGK